MRASCNPCAAGEEVELTADEARDAYACISAVMAEGYAKSGNQWACVLPEPSRLSPYVSDTHGACYVNNYANDIGADNYSLFEEAGLSPVGHRAPRTVLRSSPMARSAPGRSS